MENPFAKIQCEFDRIGRRLTLIEDFLFEIKYSTQTRQDIQPGEAGQPIAQKPPKHWHPNYFSK